MVSSVDLPAKVLLVIFYQNSEDIDEMSGVSQSVQFTVTYYPPFCINKLKNVVLINLDYTISLSDTFQGFVKVIKFILVVI